MKNTVINSEVANDNRTTVNSSLKDTTAINPETDAVLNDLAPGTILCDKYEVICPLDVVTGEADLYVCRYRNKGFVAKIYRRKAAIKEDVIGAIKGIKSPYVAELHDVGAYNGYPFEILPFYKNGSLQNKTFSFSELKKTIIPNLNEGLNILHKKGIIHKDLKPSNIMLCDNKTDVAIIDFGISSVRDSDNTVVVTKTGMTPEYSAPETFRNLFLAESDYYSLGITLYELFTGNTPYKNMDKDSIEKYVAVQRIPFPKNMPIELVNLISAVTYYDITNRKNKENPNRRWTYEEVKKWLKGEPQPIPGGSVGSFSAKAIQPYKFLSLVFA